MCGRTACTLAPDQLCKACSGNPNRRYTSSAKWRDVPGNVDSYKPRFNLSPSVYSPILVSGHQFIPKNHNEDSNDSNGSNENHDDQQYAATDLVIQPMQWGLVPSYHKGETKFGYSTINARAEDILERQTYRVPLKKGRRCVVLADGFYEWKRMAGSKQPYLIYFPQDKAISWDHPETEDGGPTWTGRRLLTMAGIFEINRTGEHPLYTYSMITVAASEKLAWMHHRMPALLDGDEAVDKWLDSENVPMEEALALLKPVENVAYHPVVISMGNVRNQGPECILPLKMETKSAIASQQPVNTLHKYFQPKHQPDKQEPDEKSEDNESEESNGEGPAPKVPKQE